MINKDRSFFQYNSRNLVFNFTPYMSVMDFIQKSSIKYVGPLVIYKIIDSHNYLLMMLDGKHLRDLLEHKRPKPAIIQTGQGSVCNLSQLKQIKI